MLGKLNMDEFAMGSSNETSAYGPVISPWKRNDGGNAALTPGGSSGGSAAAVAARIAPGVTGTDTGGSIRQPAAFTGICGHQADLRPLLALGHRRLRLLARPGRADGARRCATARSCSRRWPGSIPRTRPRSTCRCRSGKRACRAISAASASAFPRNIASTACPPRSTRSGTRASNGCKDAGAEMVEISLPHTKYALPTYYIIAPAEASSNLARYDGVRYGLRETGVKTPRRHVRRDPRRGLRRRGQAPDHDRHLCAVGRLLRRLFHQGAEGPHADQARLRPGVRAVRRDPDPDRAVGRVRRSARRAPIRSRCT